MVLKRIERALGVGLDLLGDLGGGWNRLIDEDGLREYISRRVIFF